MIPNYNFENEISSQYGIKAMDFRGVAKKLLVKYKVINQKEFDVVMWQACNFPNGSLIRKELLKTLKEMELKCRLEKTGILQVKLEL